MNTPKLLLTLSVIAGIAGCSVLTKPNEAEEANKSEMLLAKARRDLVDSSPNVHTFSSMYVPVLTLKESQLPGWYKTPKSIKVKNRALEDVISELIESRDIRVKYLPGVVRSLDVSLYGTHKTLGGYLEAIASATGYQLDVKENLVTFSKYVERVFPIRNISGNYDFAIGKKEEQSQSNNNSSNGFAAAEAVKSNGDEFSNLSGSYDPLEDFKAGVETVLGCREEGDKSSLNIGSSGGESGERSHVQQALESDMNFQLSQLDKCEGGAVVKELRSDNSLLVRALPFQMNKVEKFITEKTERELRQVRVDVTLAAIEVTEDTAFSLDFAVLDNVVGSSDLGLTTASNLSESIIGGLSSRGTATLTHTSGTNLALTALQKQGTILDKATLRGVAFNHRIAKITDINKRSFISDRPLGTTAEVGVTSSVEQDVVESGRALFIKPNIGPSDVVIYISTSLSSLIDIRSRGDEGEEVESPEISDREFSSMVLVRPGKPVLVGGFTVNEVQSITSLNGVSGITRSSTNSEVEIVMIVEAVYI